MAQKDFIKQQTKAAFARDGQVAAAEYLARTVFMKDTDRAGKPYFGHLSRVAQNVDEQYKAIAFLHDLLEDKPDWSADDLRDIGFSEFTIEGIEAVTKNPGEKYYDFIVRCSQTPQAIPVKMADLQDNSNLLRLPTVPSDEDIARTKKYWTSYNYLEDVKFMRSPAGTRFEDWMIKQPHDRQYWANINDYTDDLQYIGQRGADHKPKP